jgi:PleD family two-component response regulator
LLSSLSNNILPPIRSVNVFEILKRIKKLPLTDPGKTKIIIISSSLNDQDVDHSLKLGASHYLTKPVTETKFATGFEINVRKAFLDTVEVRIYHGCPIHPFIYP